MCFSYAEMGLEGRFKAAATRATVTKKLSERVKMPWIGRG